MSKGNSGLFSNTNGDKNSSSSNSGDKNAPYMDTPALRNHIENPEPSSTGRTGIKGAHNKENFIKEVRRIGANITGITPNPHIYGVEIISYQMPKRDKAGKLTGELQSTIHHKTVYDPKKISTDTYVHRGLQAANNTARSSPNQRIGREWSGTDNNGVHWHGYCDSNGIIISFFPDD